MSVQSRSRACGRPLRRSLLQASPATSVGRPFLINPQFRQLPPPLIVIGMHGSGTSVVSQMLMALGVHMGHSLDEHAEAGEFFALNEAVLYRAGASWDRVEPFVASLGAGHFARLAGLQLAVGTFGRLRADYLSSLSRSGNGNGNWGWKDPRNSLTLPLWLQLFPNARVVHVRRDARAAAASIHRRAMDWAARSVGPSGAPDSLRRRLVKLALNPGAAARVLARRCGMTAAPSPVDPCLDIGYCETLADQYIESCDRWRDSAAACLEIRYEDLLQDPAKAARRLGEFAVGDTAERRLHAAAALVRPNPRSVPG